MRQKDCIYFNVSRVGILLGLLLLFTKVLSAQVSIDSALRMGDHYIEFSLPDSALYFYHIAEEQLSTTNNIEQQALVSAGMAEGYRLKRQFDKARDILNALLVNKSLRQYPKVMYAIFKARAAIRFDNSRSDLCLIDLDSAMYHLSSTKRLDELMGALELSHLYARAYQREKKFTKAQRMLERLELVVDSLGIEGYRKGKVYYSIGYINLHLRKTDIAIRYFKKAEEDYERELPDKQNIPQALLNYNLAQSYWLHGLIPNALNLMNETLDILKAIDPDFGLIPTIYTRMSGIYTSVKRTEEAFEYGKKAALTNRRIYGEYSIEVAESYMEIGNTYGITGDHRQSVTYHAKAVDIFRKVYEGRDSPNLGMALYYMGLHTLILGSEEEGFKHMNEGVQMLIRKSRGNDQPTSYFSWFFASEYMRIDQPDSALRYFQESIIANARGFDNSDPLRNPDSEQINQPYVQFRSIYGKVEAFKDKYKSDGDIKWLLSAYQNVLAADSMVNSLWENLLLLRNQFWMSERISLLLDEGVKVCHELYELTGDSKYSRQAYLFAEKNKANHLISNFNVRTDNPYNVPDSIYAKEKQLDLAISELETLMQDMEYSDYAGEGAEEGQYEAQLAQRREELLMLRDYIRQEHPGYFDLKFSHDYLTLEQTRAKLLGKNDLLISYHFDEYDSAIYVFQVDQDDFRFDKVPFGKAFIEQLESFQQQLQNPGVGEQYFNEYVSNIEKLSQKLLPGLSHWKQYESIVFIPEDVLSAFPFELLAKTIQEQPKSFRDINYLIKDYNIRYGISATILNRQLGTEHLETNNKILAMAPFGNEGDLAGPREPDSLRSALGMLPHSLSEVQSISRYFASELLLGQQATEEKFRTEVDQGYSVVHLATHGQLSRENIFSTLIFSAFDTDSVNDGLLSIREVMEMSIPAELVVLSACNSGTGAVMPGEGIVSLAQGFFYAGAQSLVMTFWTANDQSSATLMEAFYQNLADGQRKSEALRNAKIDYLAQADELMTHPYYWAHFVMNGNDRPLIKSGINWYYFLLCLPLFYFLLRRFARKRKA